MEGRIGLMFCCNDDHGNFTGTVSRIDIDELDLVLEISEMPGSEDALSLEFRRPAESWQGKGGPFIRVENFREITSYCHQTHVGNIFWDYAQVIPSEAADLFNYLKAKALVDRTSGPEYLYEKFHSDKPIVAHDLDPDWVVEG